MSRVRMSRLASNSLLFVIYSIVAFGSLRLFATLNASVSPVWPPTGLAIAALLLWGPSLWPGIFFGALAANLLNIGAPAASVSIAFGNTLEAVTAWFVVSRFGKGVKVFDQGNTLPFFLLGGGLAGPLVSATIGVTSLGLVGLVDWSAYPSSWTTWFLGDAAGALTVTPLLIAILRQSRPVPPGTIRELAALITSLIFLGVAILASAVFSVIP